MRINLNGDINLYYIQSLCMAFFPGEKFSASNEQDENTPTLDINVYESSDGDCICDAYMYHDGKKGEGHSTADSSIYPDSDKRKKMAVGKAVFDAGRYLLKYTPPWGILTGVRPAKVATSLLTSGLTPTKAKRVLRDELFLNPQKAALAVNVALSEKRFVRADESGRCSVYISIPFCPSRCAYCSFVSYTTPRLLSLIDDYLNALIDDISNIFDIIKMQGIEVATVYIGGGTPSILNAEQMKRLMVTIHEKTDISNLEEFTVECGRPDTITAEKLDVLSSFGVTRISVNPQSLNDELLASIGRAHTVDDFLHAYDLAEKSGIPDINVDLIAGLPGDCFSNFAASLDAIIDMAPSNITVHTFSVKKSSEFKQTGNRIFSRSGGDAGKSVSYSQLKTKFAGYKPYYMYRQKNTVGNLENVGYAMEGHEGRYNVYMMEELHSIYAAGAGAVSKLIGRDNQGNIQKIQRIFTPKYPYEYLRRTDIPAEKQLGYIVKEFYKQYR